MQNPPEGISSVVRLQHCTWSPVNVLIYKYTKMLPYLAI